MNSSDNFWQGRRILVPALDWTRASGGVRRLYRHVDILNAHKIPAFIMHQAPGFRCTWFENQTPVTSFPEAQPIVRSNVLLIPEILAWQFTTLAPTVPRLIFSQNAYQTFAWREEHKIVPYRQRECLGTIVVSEDSRQYIEHAFPGHRVFRIHYSIDPKLFFYTDRKLRQIAYMPRKNDQDIKQVLGLLRYRGLLDNFQAIEIKDKTESETAQILRDSMIFLSFGQQEGWGLPPMEAMACGCVTIGYDGNGGREFFHPPYAIPIDQENVIGFAMEVERAIRQLQQDPKQVLEKTRAASEFVLSTYTPDREERDVVQVWEEVQKILLIADC